VTAFSLPDRLFGYGVTFGVVRIAPEGVDEDPHRATRGAHVFDLPAREPIVNGSAADTHELTGLHDRDSFAFQELLPP